MKVAGTEADANAPNAVANTAITPEPSSSWRNFLILLSFLILAALVYFFRRH